MSSQQTLTEECRTHLEKALRTECPSEKDFHVRQVLQTYEIDELSPGQ